MTEIFSPDEMKNIDLAIIGGGPAALAAALSAYENGVKNIVIIERANRLGGILNQCIHNGFGLHYFNEELTGPEYARRFEEKVMNTDIKVLLNTMVLNISKDKSVKAINDINGLFSINAKAVILAMGCRERPRGALNIPGSRPAGVISAGTAQKFINIDGYMPGKKIVILGSGDIGLIMARRMTLEGSEVKAVCEIMPYSGGLKRNIVQCLDDFNIPLKLSHTVIQVHGKDRVEGVTIAKVDDRLKPISGTEEYIECDTLMLSVGLIPENELSSDAGVKLDPVTNGAFVSQKMETSVPGIFACGNVLHVHDLVDYVTQESIKAGKASAEYINSKRNEKINRNETIKTIKIIAKNSIRYVVPQCVDITNNDSEKIQFFLRVDNNYRDKKINIISGASIIKAIKKRFLSPSEMESIELDINEIKNYDEISFELE